MNRPLFAFMALAMAGAPAYAVQLDGQSTGSVNVTVVIPPIGAALAASREGAVGLWGVNGRRQGVMIQMPREVRAREPGQVSLFVPGALPLIVEVAEGEGGVVRTGLRSDRGLTRQEFAVTLDRPPADGVMGLIIGSP